jgi:hypothetical protein
MVRRYIRGGVTVPGKLGGVMGAVRQLSGGAQHDDITVVIARCLE